MRFIHVINPFSASKTSDVFVAQPIVFESIKVARNLRSEGIELNVKVLSVQFDEDKSIIPEHIKTGPTLVRSVLDYGNFNTQKKLPRIHDILNAAYEWALTFDYIIYTNVDISLLPHFYESIGVIIDNGFDAFTITRRTIPNTYTKPDELPWMYMEAGKPHPGYDCFVFKRELFPAFELGNVCIGANFVGKAMIINMLVHSKRFKVFKDLHLTFHIGDDQAWRNPRFRDYDEHNQKEVERIIDRFLELDLPNEKRQFLEQQRLLMNRAMGGGTDRTDFIGRAARKLRKVFGA